MALTRRQRLARLLSVFKRFGYTPGPEQWAIQSSSPRFAIVTGGERAGKSMMAAAQQLGRAYLTAEEHRAEALLWLVGHEYDDVRGEWEHLKNFALYADLIRNKKRDISEPRIGPVALTAQTPGGGTITVATRSSADVSRLVRDSPHHMLLCEAGKMTREAILRCRGRVSGTRGTIFGAGTFEQTGAYGWMAQFWEEWQGENDWGGRSYNLPSWTNRFLFPLGMDDPEIAALRKAYAADQGMFEERVEGIPQKPHTLVFRTFSISGENSHVTDLAFNPDLDVYIGVDPADSAPYAVFVAHIVGEYVLMFDEVYMIDATTDEVIEECRRRPWWPYVAGGAIDVAEKSERKRWRSIGGLRLAANKVPITDGIKRFKDFLRGFDGKPRFYVDRRCKHFIDEMQRYRYRDVPIGEELAPLPIDRNNHMLKAGEYLIWDRKGGVDKKPKVWRPRQSSRSPIHVVRAALGM